MAIIESEEFKLTTEIRTPIHVISLWQPWATLFVSGIKKIETRSWPLRLKLPITLGVHAAKKWNSDLKHLSREEPFFSALTKLVDETVESGATIESVLPLGAFLGTVEIWDCYQFSGLPPSHPEVAFGDFSAGRWGWKARAFNPLPVPIPMKGHQGLWKEVIHDS